MMTHEKMKEGRACHHHVHLPLDHHHHHHHHDGQDIPCAVSRIFKHAHRGKGLLSSPLLSPSLPSPFLPFLISHNGGVSSRVSGWPCVLLLSLMAHLFSHTPSFKVYHH